MGYCVISRNLSRSGFDLSSREDEPAKKLVRVAARTAGDIGGHLRFPGTRECVAPSAPKAKGKSGKWVLHAFRLHSGGHFYLLPSAFQGVASVRNP